VFFTAHPEARLRHEVAEGQRLRQPIGLPQHMRLNFTKNELNRGIVIDNVVIQHQEQPAPTDLIVSHVAQHQRGSTHIHAVAPRMKALD
jgi:hypothetical protein